MHYNEGCPSDIIPLVPQGTNSTMFTACCGVAICDYEVGCPRCKRPVVGDNAANRDERRKIRWANATRFWPRR
jgi:hypothetical protein